MFNIFRKILRVIVLAAVITKSSQIEDLILASYFMVMTRYEHYHLNPLAIRMVRVPNAMIDIDAIIVP